MFNVFCFIIFLNSFLFFFIIQSSIVLENWKSIFTKVEAKARIDNFINKICSCMNNEIQKALNDDVVKFIPFCDIILNSNRNQSGEFLNY